MSAPETPRTADQIATGLMSEYLHTGPASFTIYPSDKDGIVKLYEQDKWLKSVRAWMKEYPDAARGFNAFLQQQEGGK